MALIDDVRNLFVGLYENNAAEWQALFARHGFDFTVDQIRGFSDAELKEKLTEFDLTIDRTRAGFQDFSAGGRFMITPAQPGKSLLYHALASPLVHPTDDGSVAAESAYPSLAQLDLVENFVYSLAPSPLSQSNLKIAVMAYQYRVGGRTSHQRHADLAFSRTGVSRVGTAKANYVRSRRSFWAIPDDDGEDLCVLPARFGVFLVRETNPVGAGSVRGGHNGAVDEDYLFPVHKLFDGNECISGKNIMVSFAEFHRNEKLRRIHQLPTSDNGIPPVPGFDTNELPFVRDSTNGGDLVALTSEGSSTVLLPVNRHRLARTVAQFNSVAGKEQIVHFLVPPETSNNGRSSRFFTSLEITANGPFRLAPEYLNVRHRVNPNEAADQLPEDINSLPEVEFENLIQNGGYFAAHFTDDSCDGCVSANVVGLDLGGALPAYSLVTAPDFFPLADQAQLSENSSLGPQTRPLSDGRTPANSTLPDPVRNGAMAFGPQSETITAVVGSIASGPSSTIIDDVQVSFLPDGASDVFAPGWDVSRTSFDRVNPNLSSLGLGSPFPEDAKLCAALSSFWPAVAPDASRTFGNINFPNQLPMLDEELGFHASHPLVQSGTENASTGWDGETGPFLEHLPSGLVANFADIDRSDYVANALAGKMSVKPCVVVTGGELLRRSEFLQRCQNILNSEGANSMAALIEVMQIEDWANHQPGDNRLVGGGYEFVFAELGQPVSRNELNRRRNFVRSIFRFHLAASGTAFQRNEEDFVFFP